MRGSVAKGLHRAAAEATVGQPAKTHRLYKMLKKVHRTDKSIRYKTVMIAPNNQVVTVEPKK